MEGQDYIPISTQKLYDHHLSLLLIARLAYQSDPQLARKVIDVQLRTSTFDRFINAGLHDEL